MSFFAKNTCNLISKCYNRLNKGKQPLERKVNKMTTYRTQYLEDMDQMDKKDTLTAEEKTLMRGMYRVARLDMSEEESLYYIAIDFNIIVTVVKRIVGKP